LAAFRAALKNRECEWTSPTKGLFGESRFVIASMVISFGGKIEGEPAFAFDLPSSFSVAPLIRF
jgi:hypothetical protein